MNKIVVSILFLVLISRLVAQVPDTWAVDVHQFELTMTVTAELEINQGPISSPSNVLAAFVGEECRGLVEMTPVGEEALFFLLVYANSDGETLEFRMWDAEVNNVIVLDQNASFVSGDALGTVDSPTRLTGINPVSFVDASDDYFEVDEDDEFNEALDILENDVYDESLALVVSILNGPDHGFVVENLDQTFSYVSDENFFGSDSFFYRVSHIYGSDSAWVHIMVQPVNDLPLEFHLQSPVDETIFWIDDDSSRTFSWEAAIDPDDDSISYQVTFWEYGELDASFYTTRSSLDINLMDLSMDVWLDWSVTAFDAWAWINAADTFSVHIASHVGVDLSKNLPRHFQVSQNFPNPFNPVTHIDYGIPEYGDIEIHIYDIAGRIVRELKFINQTPGWYSYTWNGTNFSGESVSAGLYLCQIQSGHEFEVVKMLFLK